MAKFYQILGPAGGKKFGTMGGLPEEIETFYAERGWEEILFLYVGDGHNDPRGQKMLWIIDDVSGKRGYMYVSTRQSKEVQFYINGEPIFYRIRSYGTFGPA